MIVTIDGPAGAGKSTVAKRLAREIGFEFLDTGAMYRCVTLACLRRQVSLLDTVAISEIAQSVQIDFSGGRVFLNGEDVSEGIRTPNVTKAIRAIADNQRVREFLVAAQRDWTQGKNAVTEGRDQGTVAFPHADCKIFLTASPEERAKRRVSQLIELGVDVSYDEVLELQNQRDAQDTQREAGNLRPADDAVTIWTDGMSEEDVLQRLIQVVDQKKCICDPTNTSGLDSCSNEVPTLNLKQHP